MQTLRRFGERSMTTVVGIFQDGGGARRAALALRKAHHGPGFTVSVIEPDDPELEHKLEPDTVGLWRAVLTANGGLAIAFLLVGTLAGIGLVAADLALGHVDHAWLTVSLTSVVGALLGLVFGNLMCLRPDRSAVVAQVNEASRSGRWAVVTHPAEGQQAVRARSQLATSGGWVISSL